MPAMARVQMTVATPIGSLVVSAQDDAIVAVDWGEAAVETETPLLAAAARQLGAYFDRRLTVFDLALAPAGTSFQRAVWNEMRRIPFGSTRRYGDLARAIGGVPRAVGGACGRNPIPIIIPCHRVVGAGGRIGGFSSPGGAVTKRFLLELESGAARLL